MQSRPGVGSQKFRALRDPTDVLMRHDPGRALGNVPQPTHRLGLLLPVKSVVEILVDPQRSQIVRTYGDLLEAPSRQETRQATQSQRCVSDPYFGTRKSIAYCSAYDAIDSCAHRLAPLIPFDGRADLSVSGKLRGCDNDLLPEDFSKRSDPILHLIEKFRLRSEERR